MTREKTKHYLAMWDMQGLECLFDVSFYMDQYMNGKNKKLFLFLKKNLFPTNHAVYHYK